MKSFYLVLIFTILSLTINGQGLIFDENSYKTGTEYEAERSDFILKSFSLKPYTPYVMEQKVATCVAYSTSVAITTMHAFNKNSKNITNNSLEMVSPHWIYYRNKDKTDINCNEGLNIDRVMKDVLNNGAPSIFSVEYPDFYPFESTHLCNYYPPDYSVDSYMASKSKPDEVFTVTDVQLIKSALSVGMPVVFGMNVPPSFDKSIGKSLWTPYPTENKFSGYGHAMVIVGYDDNKYGGAVEVMNSWGETWGDKGYIWIKYSDLQKYILCGYAFYKEKKFGGAAPNLSVENDLTTDIKLSKSTSKKVKPSKKWKSLGKKAYKP